MTLLKQLQMIFPKNAIYSDRADCWNYGYDNSREHTAPDFVVFPENAEQIQALVTLCYKQAIPITARGYGTGTTGAAIPIKQGIVLSFEKMHRLINLDPNNRFMIVEPGITNASVQAAASKEGFFWAPDPTSSAVCSVGGNLAVNAAGPRAVKYGTCRENTLGLQAILGDGTPITTGTQTTKGNVGYDFTRLLIGSEGTLGIITQATLKLLPKPETIDTISAYYQTIQHATDAIVRIMASALTPCTLEFIDRQAINLVKNHAPLTLPENAGALLLIELDGTQATLDHDKLLLKQLTHHQGLIDYQQASTDEERRNLWATRKALSPALRHVAPKKINEDVVVPITAIPQLLTELERMAKHYGFPIVNFGHAGNGNLHVNLLIDPADPKQNQNATDCLNELFTLVIKLNGSLSGEHGIGLVKQAFIECELSPNYLHVMRKIKQQFDPKGILNPGKLLL